MNGSDAINFWGGRAAASPLAYAVHLKKKGKVFLGGPFRFIGLGKDQEFIKSKLVSASEPIDPRRMNIKQICISEIAYIYQNFDPLFTQVENAVYWKVTIDKIGRWNWFTPKEQKKYTLDAVQIGLGINSEERAERHKDKWVALISKLERYEHPVEKEDCPWKVYGGNWKRQSFWQGEMPFIKRNNAFVHATTHAWNVFDKKELTESDTLNITQVTDGIIKNNRIHESLVHEILKMQFARNGWWVNFEVPTRNGRIDFLVKRSAAANDPWIVIEVKLNDNPEAVEQLCGYIKDIKEEVRGKKGDDSYFWPLWVGKGRCTTNIKGVVLCAYPGKDTKKEAKQFGYDVWTYKYFEDENIGIEIKDAETGVSILD